MLTQWNLFGFDDLDRGFAAFDDFRQEMERVFQRFGVDWARNAPLWTGSAAESGGPNLQLSDRGDELHLYADVPGFAPGDLQVSFEQGTLTIRGERSDATPEGYSVHRKER